MTNAEREAKLGSFPQSNVGKEKPSYMPQFL